MHARVCPGAARELEISARAYPGAARVFEITGTVLCCTGQKIALEVALKLLFEEHLLGTTQLCSTTLCCALLVHGYARDHTGMLINKLIWIN